MQPVSGTSADRKRQSSSDTVRTNGAPGKPLRILLVEDSPLLRSRLENMLSQYAAFKVTGLASAEAEAVEKLESVPYDAIVVDVELRPGSGIGVIRQARARNPDKGDGGHVWIIVLTNYDLPTVRERCMRPAPITSSTRCARSISSCRSCCRSRDENPDLIAPSGACFDGDTAAAPMHAVTHARHGTRKIGIRRRAPSSPMIMT